MEHTSIASDWGADGPTGADLSQGADFGSQIAGIVLGARVPVILTSRADTVLARMASCAMVLVVARRGIVAP